MVAERVTTPLLLCAQCQAPLANDERVCPRCHALQPTRESFAPHRTIYRGDSRLVVDARLGEGGMGVVWRAWLFRPPGTPGSEAPEPVALKVLRPQPTAKSNVRDLFLREAEALRRLSHPNVVGYNDLFEHEGCLVLSLEYVEGETLQAIIARHVARAHLSGGHGLPSMPLLRAWYYFQQLLGALAAIHAMGIVHRDVKPSNVLVRRDGLVKLGDFGIARLVDSPITEATRELALGTGAYMSPEQVESRPLDGRSDLYSAATVLYEMLSGRTPFSSDRGEFLVRKDQVDAPVPSIRALLPQALPVLDALFARALSKDPANRFEGAIEMGDAFRRALGLPDTPEWQAQADIAVAARTIAQTRSPELDLDEAQKKLTTLREFVVDGYKTMRLASM
ncbi:MAG: serine/threonine-protein kinase [Polyangiaceae bacterium]